MNWHFHVIHTPSEQRTCVWFLLARRKAAQCLRCTLRMLGGFSEAVGSIERQKWKTLDGQRHVNCDTSQPQTMRQRERSRKNADGLLVRHSFGGHYREYTDKGSRSTPPGAFKNYRHHVGSKQIMQQTQEKTQACSALGPNLQVHFPAVVAIGVLALLLVAVSVLSVAIAFIAARPPPPPPSPPPLLALSSRLFPPSAALASTSTATATACLARE